MNKLTITTFAVALAFATTAGADNTANHGPVPVTTTDADANDANHVAHHPHHHHKHLARSQADAVTSNGHYREVRVGDPSIVYDEIGTAGAQRGNTIVPFYGEPIQSVRPYEVRYDYNEFSQNDEYAAPHHHHYYR